MKRELALGSVVGALYGAATIACGFRPLSAGFWFMMVASAITSGFMVRRFA